MESDKTAKERRQIKLLRNMVKMELPIVKYHGINYTFDYRLNELRYLSKNGLGFIHLTNTQIELLSYAISTKDIRLININLDEILNRVL